MLSTNQTLQNRYRVTAEVGQLGSGVGYAAFDSNLGKQVMLKETLGDTEASTFRSVSQSVRHQSLLCATDSFVENGKSYVVMEYVEGQTLGELLEKKRGPFPIRDVALWADGLLDALNHLHNQSPAIIHSNIKPQSIKVSPGGNVKLLVYGGGNGRSSFEAMSFDANVLGYLPMEQIWRGLDVGSQKVIRSGYDDRSAELLEMPLDVQSDVYSMAATIYHLVTGRVPVDALTRSIDMLEGKEDPLVPASKFNPEVPAEVSEVLNRAMQIRREERYGSASILRQVLRSAFSRAKEPARATDGTEDETVLELPASRPAIKPAIPAPIAPSAVAQSNAQSAAPPRPVVRPGMQSAESRQLEIIKRQLREAEMRRQEAERRAAEAEKKLLEHETSQFKLSDVAAALPPQAEPVANISAPAPRSDVAETVWHDDDLLFGAANDDAPAGNKSMAKVAGAAVAVIALAIGGWAVWNFSSGAAAEPTPAKVEAPTATVSAPETNPATENPVVTGSTENQPAPTADAQPVDDRQAADPRLKPTQTPQQQAKKQPTPTPKSTQPQKKSVTLDDLLKDN